MLITIDADLLRETLALLALKQSLVDTLVRLADEGAPDLLAGDLRAMLAEQSVDTSRIIARVQEAFLP